MELSEEMMGEVALVEADPKALTQTMPSDLTLVVMYIEAVRRRC